jgi:hypothetical protein
VGDAVAQVHQGGQQPVDEHQPVLCTGADRPPARPIGQSRVLARLPARPQLGDQLRQDLPGTIRSLGDRRQRRLGSGSSTHQDLAPSVTSKAPR